MEKKTNPLTWQNDFMNNFEVESIENYFHLINNINILPVFKYPFRTDITVAMLCLKGMSSGMINLKKYESQAPCFVILQAGQILQYEYISDDFECLCIIMSKQFTENLFNNARDRLPILVSTIENPVISLNNDSLEQMKIYYGMFQKIVQQKDLGNKMEIVKHLSLAFFYYSGSHLHNLESKTKKSKHETLVENFIKLVQENYISHRNINFYADKLCLTPKYLSTIIRQNSGKTAGDWIDEHVLLEAKALLKSTNMTIQQISDSLNFPSQSFFGKYFKRLSGISPKEYRSN